MVNMFRHTGHGGIFHNKPYELHFLRIRGFITDVWTSYFGNWFSLEELRGEGKQRGAGANRKPAFDTILEIVQ